jgi:hypothetical protein
VKDRLQHVPPEVSGAAGLNEVPTIRGSVRWALRHWRARLRRERASIALLVLLLFGAGEPLLCIVHCYLWLPIASPISVATHHHLGATGALSVLVARESPALICDLENRSGQGSNEPFATSPQPFHEMVPPLLLLLIPPLLIISRLAAPPGDAPQVFLAPPFRPPISFAG